MRSGEVEWGRRYRRPLKYATAILVVAAICAFFVISYRQTIDPEGARIAESSRLEGLHCKVSSPEVFVVLGPDEGSRAISILRRILRRKTNTEFTGIPGYKPETSLYYYSIDADGHILHTGFAIYALTDSYVFLVDVTTREGKWIEDKGLVRDIDRFVDSLADTGE